MQRDRYQYNRDSLLEFGNNKRVDSEIRTLIIMYISQSHHIKTSIHITD